MLVGKKHIRETELLWENLGDEKMDQNDFINRIIEATNPACGLEAIQLDGNKHLCKKHKHCDYREMQKGGALYCTFGNHIRALADGISESEPYVIL